jgi:4a-hydroxytetrahydrobiopterin dehydratase
MSETTQANLAGKRCRPCEGGVEPLDATRVKEWLGQVDGWTSEDGAIRREFTFKDFYRTMAFVNAVAWIANSEDHHPDLEVGYRRCLVTFSTHAIGGLSENDFICAAKVNALVSE